MVGYKSVEAMESGVTRTSVVITKEAGKFVADLTDLSNIARQERSVDYHYINGLNGPTQEFVDEFIHCIGSPTALPHYSKMIFTPVEFNG
jgi:hypothetical protein